MITDIINNNPNIKFLNLENEYKNTESKITYLCDKHGEQLDELYISYKVEVVVIVLLNEQEQVKYQQQTL